MLLTWIGIVVIASIGLLVVRRRERAVLLGAQLAAAEARDAAHERTGPSPLEGKAYDRWRGEMRLLDIEPLPLDLELRALLPHDAAAARAFRDASTMDDFYLLLHFARRASVFALRGKEGEWARAGLTALAMIDPRRIDERDLLVTLPVVLHAARWLGMPLRQMTDAAAGLSDPATAEAMRQAAHRAVREKNLLASSMLAEVPGRGFVQRDFDRYRPTLDLIAPAIAIRDELRRHQYEADIEIASALPPVWFPAANRPAATEALAHVPATLSLYGALHPDAHERADAQTIMVWVVETRSPQEAASLATLATGGATGIATLVVQEGALFCLAVGRSIETGVADYESAASMQRFTEAFRAALRTTSAS